MARQIIKQPNGRWALWSSITDSFILEDATRAELVEFLTQEKAGDVEEQVAKVCNQLDAGGKPYFQFTMTYEEAKQCEASREQTVGSPSNKGYLKK